jgi:hypothetical protein
MADQLQLRGGTTAQTATFTGALREVTVDTDKDTVVVHDNATVGGKPLLREDLSNLPAGTIDNADINASAAIAGTKISPDFGSQTVTTTGVISSALGAEATPSITFTGDLNTGIYSPGADQLAVATNGVERLRLSSTGQLTIGATSDGSGAAKLSSTTSDVGGTIGATTQLAVVNANGTVGNFAGIRFNYYNDGDSGGKFAYIGSVLTSAATNGSADIVFGTRPTSTTTISERVRITSGGLVGIGTSAPSSLLHLSVASAAVYRLPFKCNLWVWMLTPARPSNL